MDINIEFPHLFDKPIQSIDDCKRIVSELNKIIDVSGQQYKCFYRGDMFERVLQSKYFQKNPELQREHIEFNEWVNSGSSFANDFLNLANMQHYSDIGTRLLDFSEDILVALRFACGDVSENCNKRKITVVMTTYVSSVDSKEMNSIMKLVNAPYDRIQENLSAEEQMLVKHDYFVIPERPFKRIERQKGCFCVLGNISQIELESGMVRNKKEKVTHYLDDLIGRGTKYAGYIGKLIIDETCLDYLRNELDNMDEYNINYLLEK